MNPAAKAYCKQLGKNIRAIRALQDRTQKEMAAYLQMSVANYSNIENGYTSVNTFKLNQLAILFSLKESDIIDFHLHPIFQPNSNK